MRLPRVLVETWSHEPDWLDALPRLVADCAEQWSLELEPPVDTPHSLVLPARDVVLKLNAPSHLEADREADALEGWDGRGAVRLVARDDERRALLLERCRPGTCLWDTDADEVFRNTDDISRWLDALVDLGFDRERSRGWGVAHNLAWAWDERDGWSEHHVEEARRILSAR